jgi:hypothetical protein
MVLVQQSKQELDHKRTKTYCSRSCPVLPLALVLVLVGREKKKVHKFRCAVLTLHNLSPRTQLHAIADYSSPWYYMRKENQNHHLCAAHIFGTEKARCPEHIYDVRDEKQGRREEDKIKEQSRGPKPSGSTNFVLAPPFPVSGSSTRSGV